MKEKETKSNLTNEDLFEGVQISKQETQSIKKEIAGKKSGDVQSTIKSIPGVTDVTVKLSPFWVTTVPTDLSKVVINISKS